MNVCGICGGTALIPLFTARDLNFAATDEVFTIERCQSCGIAQTVPRPPDGAMGKYYPAVYYPIGDFDVDRHMKTIGRYQHEKVALLAMEKQNGRVLDVGCGAGYFVREALKAGFAAEGVEFNADAVEFGRRQWNLPITVGDAQTVSHADGAFDAITLWQVLEHLSHPAELLETVRRLLRDDGVLILAVPNFASLQSRVFRDRWYHLEVPRHLYHFDPASLRALLARKGFRVDRERHDSTEHNWAGILGSIVPLTPRNNSPAGRAIRKFAGRPLSRMLAGVETALKSGGTFTVVARKF